MENCRAKNIHYLVLPNVIRLSRGQFCIKKHILSSYFQAYISSSNILPSKKKKKKEMIQSVILIYIQPFLGRNFPLNLLLELHF